MKKSLIFCLFFCIQASIFAQKDLKTIGQEVRIDLASLRQRLQQANFSNQANLPVIDLPSPQGNLSFRLQESPVMENQPADMKTYSGLTFDGQTHIRVSITASGFTAILRYQNAYYFIEPIDGKNNLYRLYSLNETERGKCDVNEQGQALSGNKNGRVLSVAPFPVGTQLRVYRMAAAATNGMTTALGGQTNTRDKIVSIINAVNLIYELEASIRFSLISQTTTSMSLIFTSAASDPFTVNSSFASASNAQTGFTTLNTNSTLLYNQYDVGHTFNAYNNGSGPTYYVRGQAGPTPCVDASKARGWTEFRSDAVLGTVVSVFAHETGHQFQAWHTFNAVGGSADSPTFCTGGWDAQTAIEPGSGSTLMGYGGNCNFPTNYVLTAPNSENYFHTKSLEQIFTTVNTASTCFSNIATGNSPPVATAGAAYTIPKGTPFTLIGSATDANSADVLSYVWEEYDVASANDQGAFGSSVNGTGGYSAANSPNTAPIFRSRMSNSTSRTFPALSFILNNANLPADNEGEVLPQVSRTMNFRFTVRDNRANGGGVDSDNRVITVDATKGPFTITAPNTAVTYTAGSSQTITWNVNGTASLSANVKISLSIDGGSNFNYVLANSTPNDGTEALTIPANAVNSSTCRIKISSTNSTTAEFFDISDVNFSINNVNCIAQNTSICPVATVSGSAGSAAFNLGLGYITSSPFTNNSRTYSVASPVQRPVINNTNSSSTTCQVSAWGNAASTLVAFRVSQTGSYTISAVGDNSANAQPYTIFTSNTVFDCSTFVGSNAYGAIGLNSSRDFTLNECTTYYILFYTGIFGNANNVTLNVVGTGNALEVLSNPVGYSYTYIAVNQSSGLIAGVSSTSNFTTLPSGTYTVYGLQYANAVNPNSLLNLTITQMYSSGNCVLLSANAKTLNITAAANTVTSIGTGNWESTSTWDVGRVPLNTDNVIISPNHVVTISTIVNAKTVDLKNSGKLNYANNTAKLNLNN